MELLMGAAVVGIIGLLIGLLLGVASEKFKVKVDEKEILIREQLPGNNCGACGYPGCDGLASAIASGKAAVNQCPVGGSKVGNAIATIMGVEAKNSVREVAYVRCSGTCDKAKTQYYYYGIKDCQSASVVPGQGDKKCFFGCMGYGSCVKACEFDAISIIDGVAVVDKEKCKACGKCVAVCPNHVIELVPYDNKYHVSCNSSDKALLTRNNCETGCIGCGLCVRTCEHDAISVTDNLAHIDYDKCTNCGMCKEKCPRHIIQ
ncbi:MAG: RnfABCDGE type electron transport complex subunit B [Thomasclavelia sp.]|jgi:electron transport complex protein RnfB|nr:RnfABCDGE type electron transport complex subunit B [Thomasclavelia sp.]